MVRSLVLATVAVSGMLPAAAQSGTDAIKGKSIATSIDYLLKVRRGGQEFDAPFKLEINLNIASDGRVTGSVNRSSSNPRGPIAASRSISTTLGKPGEIKGSGSSIIVMSGNTLTILRTFDAGGWKIMINFAGGGCTVRAPMMREGAKTTNRDHMAGGSVEIISARQISSSCRIS